MPISDKQLAANQANSKRSTGPRSPEGKRKVSRNAVKHGLTARRSLVLAHQQESYDQLASSLRAEVQPWGALEIDAFQQLLHAAWQLRRADDFENSTFDPGAATETQLQHFERLTRLRAALERSYQRAYRRLRELQTTRSAEDTRSVRSAIANSVTTPLAAIPREKKQTHFFPEALFDQYLELCVNRAAFEHLPYRTLFRLHDILAHHPRLAKPAPPARPKDGPAK